MAVLIFEMSKDKKKASQISLPSAEGADRQLYSLDRQASSRKEE